MSLVFFASAALALDCDDIALLVDAGVPNEIVRRTIRDAAPAPSRTDIACLTERGIAEDVVDAARRAAGVLVVPGGTVAVTPPEPRESTPATGSPTRAAPTSAASKVDGGPKETPFGDWTLLELGDAVGASTKATNDRSLLLMVNCEAGLFQISLLNLTLMMMNVPYRTEVSYDDAPPVRIADDASLPFENLAQILRGSIMHVRWSFYEGTVAGDFSLRGSTAALDAVIRRCSVRPTP